MLTWGGAMSGYWAIGSEKMAPIPLSITIVARTQARIGLSMNIRDSMAQRAVLRAGAFWPGGATRCGVFAGTGLIAAPGLRLPVPWTMTRSPGLTPAVTTQYSPWMRGAIILRCSALLSLP